MKKKISLLMCLILCVSLFVSVDIKAQEQSVNLHKVVIVQELLDELNEVGDYVNVKVLKDYDDTERYYYLPFSTGGYLIYDVNLNIIHEYSVCESNAKIDGNSEVYYGGALVYLIEQNGKFYDLSLEVSIGNKREIIEKSRVIQEKMKNNFQYSRTSLPATRNTIKGTVPNYSYNPNGICGSTASAMMLRWYNNNVNGKYVPSNLETSDGVALIKHLKSYIDGSTPGSSAGDVFTGIQSYCKKQGVSHAGGFDRITADYIIGRVDSYKRPYIMGLYNHPTYKDHWVTGYGYRISGGTVYAIVNDGHGKTGVSLNLTNADYIVW